MLLEEGEVLVQVRLDNLLLELLLEEVESLHIEDVLLLAILLAVKVDMVEPPL